MISLSIKRCFSRAFRLSCLSPFRRYFIFSLLLSYTRVELWNFFQRRCMAIVNESAETCRCLPPLRYFIVNGVIQLKSISRIFSTHNFCEVFSYYLDIINPKRRFRSSRETQFTPENVEAILISHCAVFLQSRRSFTSRMQFLPLAFCCKKKREKNLLHNLTLLC